VLRNIRVFSAKIFVTWQRQPGKVCGSLRANNDGVSAEVYAWDWVWDWDGTGSGSGDVRHWLFNRWPESPATSINNENLEDSLTLLRRFRR